MSSYKQFIKKGGPRQAAYATADGLHLNGFGTDVLEQFFQQVMTPQYVQEQVNSKRVQRLAALPY